MILQDSEVSAEYKEQMIKVVRLFDTIFNGEARGADRKVGFVLLAFPFDNGGNQELLQKLNYMSNGARREDIVCLFKEMIARFEGQPQVTGTA